RRLPERLRLDWKCTLGTQGKLAEGYGRQAALVPLAVAIGARYSRSAEQPGSQVPATELGQRAALRRRAELFAAADSRRSAHRARGGRALVGRAVRRRHRLSSGRALRTARRARSLGTGALLLGRARCRRVRRAEGRRWR